MVDRQLRTGTDLAAELAAISGREIPSRGDAAAEEMVITFERDRPTEPFDREVRCFAIPGSVDLKQAFFRISGALVASTRSVWMCPDV